MADTRTRSEAVAAPVDSAWRSLIMNITIREMAPGDWPTVAAIYREGIETGHATFEAEERRSHL